MPGSLRVDWLLARLVLLCLTSAPMVPSDIISSNQGVETAGSTRLANGTSATLNWSSPVKLNLQPNGVSCQAPAFCEVYGGLPGLTPTSPSAGLVTTYTGNSWLPAKTIDSDSPLVSMSCPNASFCAALDELGRVLYFRGVAWTAPDPLPKASASWLPFTLSCPSPLFCMAVGWTTGVGQSLGGVSTFNGRSWSTPDVIDPDGQLTSVSCASGSFCAATDLQGDVFFFNGTTWSPARCIVLGCQNPPTLHEGSQISCGSPVFCAALTEPLELCGCQPTASLFIGAEVPAVYSFGSRTSVINSVSCTSDGFCAATLSDFAGPGNSNGSVLTFDGNRWSNHPLDAGGGLGQISCADSTFCMAVDVLRDTAYLGKAPAPPPVSEKPPVEPCVRAAIEHTANFGLTLFSVAGQQQSSIDKDLTSDGLFHVTAHSDTGLGLEVLDGFKAQFPGAVQAQSYIDNSFHVDFGSTQRTYWTTESDANQAIQFANEWGNVTSSDQTIWNSRLVSDSSQLGLDVGGYAGFGVGVKDVGVNANSGDSGVLWLTHGTDPQTGASFNSGVLHLTFQQGAGAGAGLVDLEGVLSGDVVATVTYTEDRQGRPDKLLIEIEAGVTGKVGVAGSDSWDFFKNLFASLSVGVGVQGTLEVDASVQLALTSPKGLDLLGAFAQSLTDSNAFLSTLRSVVSGSEMRVTVYSYTGTTNEAGGGLGAGLFLTFGFDWGNASLTKTLVKAGYADNGLNLREWTQCEDGGTPASLDTA